jgi:hypothetical protein
MPKKERYPIDRRSGTDRRKAHNLDYFLSGGEERRSWNERRSQIERRKDWIRASDWSSVFLGDLFVWKSSV